jgi:hypothetical protein
MTDLEKLKELLTSFGVGFTIIETDDYTVLQCKEGANKISGYSYFFTNFHFGKFGQFVNMGAYE